MQIWAEELRSEGLFQGLQFFQKAPMASERWIPYVQKRADELRREGSQALQRKDSSSTQKAGEDSPEAVAALAAAASPVKTPWRVSNICSLIDSQTLPRQNLPTWQTRAKLAKPLFFIPRGSGSSHCAFLSCQLHGV